MDNYTPIYIIVKNYIKEKIEANVLKPGDKIPSENELAAMFNCSRVTINSAITQLRMEGIVNPVRGKGTFVRAADNVLSNKIDGEIFSYKISSEGHADSHKLLSMEILYASQDDKTKLMLLPGEKYHYFTRLMYSEEKNISLEYIYLPYVFYPHNIIDKDLIENEYLHSFIKKYCNKKPYRLQTNISISYPDELQQKYLKAYREEPLLLWHSIVYDVNNVILGYTKNYARPEDFRPYLNMLL